MAPPAATAVSGAVGAVRQAVEAGADAASKPDSAKWFSLTAMFCAVLVFIWAMVTRPAGAGESARVVIDAPDRYTATMAAHDKETQAEFNTTVRIWMGKQDTAWSEIARRLGSLDKAVSDLSARK